MKHKCKRCGGWYFTWRTYTNPDYCEDCRRIPLSQAGGNSVDRQTVTELP